MQIKSAPLTDLVRILGRRFREDRCIQIASSLTFTTLLALVPIITVALTVVSAFPVFESLMTHVQRFLLNNFVPESVSSLSKYAAQFSENATQLTAVGVAFVAVTALMLMITIDTAFNDIWRTSRPRRLLQRILVYWMVLTVGPLFVGASLSLTSYLIKLSLGLIDNPPGLGILMLRFASLLLTSVALALLYWAVPNRPVIKRDALIGGMSAGICLEAMKHGFSFYIGHFGSYELVYGAFAAVPGFLMWIYLSWLIVIGGALLAALLPEWRERAGQSEPAPGSDFFDALQVLKVLWRAHASGAVVSISQLHPAVKVRLDHLEKILTTLSGAGWIAVSGVDGWLLSRDAAAIKVEEIYRLFVFNTSAHVPARHSSAELDSLVYEISTRIAGQLQITLEQLFRQAEPAAALPGKLTAS
ncbi:MAG: rane protein [Betaproteobacteria bacterium]|nr:rane protein [Betaproteobacteria bacterium]